MTSTKTVLSLLFGVVIASGCPSPSPVEPDPTLTLGLSPTTLSIQQNAQGTSTLTLTRSGDVDGSVALSATGAPTGMTVTLDPTNTDGNSSAITVTAGSGVVANTYPITIQGQATNATSSATLTVTVAAGSNTTYRFCDQSVLFAAFQDGSGPWTVAPIVNNASIFNIGSGRGAVVYVESLNNVPYVTFDYGTQAELNGIECGSAPATRMVSGTAANIAADQLAYVAMGGSSAIITAASPSFTLNPVPDSPTDLVAARLEVGTTADVADKIIVRRSLDTNSPLQLLDFNAAEAATPVSSTLTIGNLAGDPAALSVRFGTSFETTFVPVYYDALSTLTARTYVGFATPQPTDLHRFTILVIPDAVGSSQRVLLALFRDASSRTLTLGPVVAGVTITKSATTPYVLLRAQYTTQPEYNKNTFISYFQSAGGSLLRKYDLEVSRGYLGTSTALDITLPDLTGLSGWNPGWSLAPGTATQWQLNASGGNDPATLDGLITIGASQAGVASASLRAAKSTTRELISKK